MANGIEQDVRELRSDVKNIATKGCAFKDAHDKSIGDLWIAIGDEGKERSSMFIKTIILVVTIVVGAMVANIYATSTVVEQVISKAMAAQAGK